MIETKKEAQAAVVEIQELTGWSLSGTARKADLSIPVITRLMNDESMPTMETRFKLDKLLKRMRKRDKKLESVE
jgi:transcriptional regulator with XRE-family HTH domain